MHAGYIGSRSELDTLRRRAESVSCPVFITAGRSGDRLRWNWFGPRVAADEESIFPAKQGNVHRLFRCNNLTVSG